MEDVVVCTIDGQTVLLPRNQLKTFCHKTDSGLFSSVGDSLVSVTEENAQSDCTNENMQEHLSNESSCQPVIEVLQNIPEDYLDGSTLIQIPFNPSFALTTPALSELSLEDDNRPQNEEEHLINVIFGDKVDLKIVIKGIRPDMLNVVELFREGYFAFYGQGQEDTLDLQIVSDPPIDVDLERSATPAEELDSSVGDTIMTEDEIEVISKMELDYETRNSKKSKEIVVKMEEDEVVEKMEEVEATDSTSENEVVIKMDEGEEEQESEVAMKVEEEENGLEEGEIEDDSCREEEGGAALTSLGTRVVCSYCRYASPDPNICQRCRRALQSSFTPPPVEESTDLSESDSSPTKREHKSRRQSRKKCKRGDRRREERKKEQNKIEEQEETVVLSSDDEDKRNKANGPTPSWPKPLTDIFEREPVITADDSQHDSLRASFTGGGVELERLLDSSDIEQIRLDCRSVRFGSYKVKPQGNIVLTEHGLKLKVPSLTKTSKVIKILMNDIVKVFIHFGKSGQVSSMTAPTFFYYITHAASKRIREALHMSVKNKGPYFDPTSKEEQHKRITLLPETVTEQDRLFIKSIYESRCIMEELTWVEANDILIRAAPKDVQHDLNLKKDSAAVKHHPAPGTSGDISIQTIMVYPPPPFKGGISINTEDYGCLREDQFLNDVIIDFYLKYLWLNVFTEEDKKRTHIFSSFFYKRLTMLPPRNAKEHLQNQNLSPAEKRHARVKGWTKSVDIFEKDFIIIPINEKSHWFLGIICFPGLNGPVRMSDNTPVPNISRRKDGNTSVLAGGQTPVKLWGTTISLVKTPASEKSNSSQSTRVVSIEPEEDRGDESERDEADADDDEMEPDTSDEESTKDDDLLDEATPRINKVKPNLEPIKQPCILIFDSLAVQSRAKVVATLREYLQVEWKIRHKGKPKDFSKEVFKGAVPKVPQQPNFVDCGLYLLQFVEAFFKHPIADYRMPIKSIKDWFPIDIVSQKRYNIMVLLHEIMREQKIDTSQLNLPHLDLSGEFYDDEEEDGEDGLGEHLEFEEEEEEEEEGMPDMEDEDEEIEDSEEFVGLKEQPQPHSQAAKGRAVEVSSGRAEGMTSRSEVVTSRPPEIGRGVEVSRLEVGRGVEVSRVVPQQEKTSSLRSSTSSQRLDSPASWKVPSSVETRPEPVSKPRLPDSVTICEANSKRKLSLSLQDIRKTTLKTTRCFPVSPNAIDKLGKKPRLE